MAAPSALATQKFKETNIVYRKGDGERKTRLKKGSEK